MTSNPPPLRIGLKYCGGCKPHFDRVALVRRIAERMGKQAVFVPPDSPDLALILAVQGCATACADLSRFNGRAIRTVTGVEDTERFMDHLATLMLRKESS